jgi:small neutral amino acid transporter SnatA (MarC family)
MAAVLPHKPYFCNMFEASVFVTILIGLFSLINPLSALPVYIGLTQDDTEEYKLNTLRKKSILGHSLSLYLIRTIFFV